MSFTAAYGADCRFYDVEAKIKKRFIKDGRICIPKNVIFNKYFGDPCPRKKKVLYIKTNNNTYIFKEGEVFMDIIIPLQTSDSPSLIIPVKSFNGKSHNTKLFVLLGRIPDDVSYTFNILTNLKLYLTNADKYDKITNICEISDEYQNIQYMSYDDIFVYMNKSCNSYDEILIHMSSISLYDIDEIQKYWVHKKRNYHQLDTETPSSLSNRPTNADLTKKTNGVLRDDNEKKTQIIEYESEINTPKLRELNEVSEIKKIQKMRDHNLSPIKTKLFITINDLNWLDPLSTGCKEYYIDTNLLIAKADLVIIPNDLKEIYEHNGVSFDNIHHVITEFPHANFTCRKPYIPLIEKNSINIFYLCGNKQTKSYHKETMAYLSSNYRGFALNFYTSDNLAGLVDNFENCHVVNTSMSSNKIGLLNSIKPNLCICVHNYTNMYEDLAFLLRSNLPLITDSKFNTFGLSRDNLIALDTPTSFTLATEICKMVDLIIDNQKKAKAFEPVKLFVNRVPPAYINIFGTSTNLLTPSIIDAKLNNLYHKQNYERIQKKIKVFAIYFPQFHSVEENNINFYDDYTDLTNLRSLKMDTTSTMNGNVVTPLPSWFGYYDLILDDNIIDRQVRTAKSFGIRGFAVYHYWFSNNHLFPNRNKVMYKATEKMFANVYTEFDLFFIWPNENWNDYLTNDHTSINVPDWITHFNYLLPFFKHSNYLKVENKPVFFILHYFLFSKEVLSKMLEIWNELAIKNGFNGIYISFIMQHQTILRPGSDAYYVNTPAWKDAKIFGDLTVEGNKYLIDYESYLPLWEKEILKQVPGDKDKILNIFTDFDNTARNLYKTQINKIASYGYKNATRINFETYLDKCFNLYKTIKNDSKIFLINAWNEWGENMVLEPSQEFGFDYLTIIRSKLLEHFNDPIPTK